MTEPPEDGQGPPATVDSDAFGHLSPALSELLQRIPRQAGVYLLKDRHGTILYVGKAKHLFSRVRSYFLKGGSDTRAFVPILPRVVRDIETIVVQNEKEALLLENTLIKRHKPRFNVLLRDDKSYLVLRLDPRAEYPRLEITRQIKDDGARYFGPYHSATACRKTVRLVNRHFQLRTCSDRAMANRKRPCLQHQIGRCLAPCVYEVDRAGYAELVHDVTLFLRGHGAELLRSLAERMRAAAASLEFELAARLRDQIAALEKSQLSQQVVSDTIEDLDVFGFYREGDCIDFTVLLLRDGRLTERRPFSLSGQEFPDDEVLSAFVSRFYDRGEPVPRHVLLPLAVEDLQAKQAWLAELKGGPVTLAVPQRGKRRQLILLAEKNAQSNFVSRRQHDQDAQAMLATVQERFRLTRPPRTIECFDISGFQGRQVVASMVVLVDCVPATARYRRFKLRTEQNDDFASMYEVLSRRFARAAEAGWELPDLIVVDGGKAQLSMALTALGDVGLPDGAATPDVIALAKERSHTVDASTEERAARPERVFLPQIKDPLPLRAHSTELHLLTLIRDEAHRFAISYHKKLRGRQSLKSKLDDIPGIGPKRRQLLLRTLGSLKQIEAASVQELAAIPTMSLRAAEAVAAYFCKQSARPAVQGEVTAPPGDDEAPPETGVPPE